MAINLSFPSPPSVYRSFYNRRHRPGHKRSVLLARQHRRRIWSALLVLFLPFLIDHYVLASMVFLEIEEVPTSGYHK